MSFLRADGVGEERVGEGEGENSLLMTPRVNVIYQKPMPAAWECNQENCLA